MSSSEQKSYAAWELPEVIWEVLEPLLPIRNWWMGRPTEVDLRRVAAGIFYVLRTGMQWNALPREQFGPSSTVYYYFRQWADAGVFEQLWAKALEQYDLREGLEWTWQSIDGAMTKAPQGGEKKRPQSDRSGQVGDQAQPADGRTRDAGWHRQRWGELARSDAVGRDAGGGGRAASGAQRGGAPAPVRR